MPTISMFYGIRIFLYFFDNQKHKHPHIHARCQGQSAVIAIDDGCLLGGEIPPAKMKLVLAWVEIHKEELFADWELAVNGERPFPIAPLH